MTLSTKTRYGTRLMIDLATHSPQGPVLLGDIAKRQKISEKYLWNLAAPLKAAGFITAQRGVNGGYTLARAADTITVNDIVTVLEGPVSLVDCKDCTREACVTSEIWQGASDALIKVFSSYKVSDLVKMADRMRGKETKIYSGFGV